MTVAELIEQLSKHPPEIPVLVNGYEGGYNTPNELCLTHVSRKENNPWYAGEYDDYEGIGDPIAAVVLSR